MGSHIDNILSKPFTDPPRACEPIDIYLHFEPQSIYLARNLACIMEYVQAIVADIHLEPEKYGFIKETYLFLDDGILPIVGICQKFRMVGDFYNFYTHSYIDVVDLRIVTVNQNQGPHLYTDVTLLDYDKFRVDGHQTRFLEKVSSQDAF